MALRITIVTIMYTKPGVVTMMSTLASPCAIIDALIGHDPLVTPPESAAGINYK